MPTPRCRPIPSMGSRGHISRPPIPLAVQLAHLQRYWPGLQPSIIRSLLTAEGWVVPSPLARSYRISLSYRLDEHPKVWVKEPRIVPFRTAKEPVPHVYSRASDPRPCLYYPNGREWHPGKVLASTVLPWLLVWLTFYEVWLATGAWLGEGVDHGPGEK